MKEQTKQRMLDLLALLMGILVILGRAIPLRPLEKVLFFAVPADRLLFSALTIVLLFRRFLRRRAGSGRLLRGDKPAPAGAERKNLLLQQCLL